MPSHAHFESRNTCTTILSMAGRVRKQFQIDASVEIRNRAKAVAYSRNMTLTVFVLSALAKENDKELTKLIDQYLDTRPQKGRPQRDT